MLSLVNCGVLIFIWFLLFLINKLWSIDFYLVFKIPYK